MDQTPLTEQQIRAIVQDELRNFASNTRTTPDRTIHERDIQMLDGRSIQVGRKNGTMIGTADDQKVAFFGTTPVAQQNAITTPSGGSTVDTSARASIAAIIAAIKNIGITK